MIGLSTGLSSRSAQAALFAVPCSLPELTTAIGLANGNGQPDTLELTASCTYTLTSQLTLQPDGGHPVTINGNGATISGGGTTRVLVIQVGATLTLNDVTVSDGFVPSSTLAGGILNGGTLTLGSSTVANNTAGSSGGGIYNAGGISTTAVLTLDGSTVSDNTAGAGAGIHTAGRSLLTVTDSTIADNTSTSFNSGGGINNLGGGALTVTGSTISNNSAGTGGGLVTNHAAVTISNSTFSGNHAAGFGGGGILSGGSGTLTVTDSTFSGNSAANHGGGIRNEGKLFVANSTFSGNSAANGGGLSTHTAQTNAAIFASVDRSTFSENTAASTGAGARNDGRLFITRSTFAGNASAGHGGGIANAFVLEVTNSTFAANTAAALGGGIHNGGPAMVTNSTFVSNSADTGGGINNAPAQGTQARNTIVVSSMGGNCGGAFTTTASLADDGTCAGFMQVTLAQLNLGPLSGSPAYFPLLPGSVAIDAGDDSTCPPIDQPGNPRPRGAHCDIGAHEADPNQPPAADAGGPYTVDEGAAVQLTGSGTDPDGDPLTYAWDLDNDGTFESNGQNVVFPASGRDGPESQAVALRVCDPSECATDAASVEILNVAPAITSVAVPTDPVQVGAEIGATGAFSDPGTADTHVTTWDWGDGTSSAGTVDQAAGAVSGTHAYAAPGVYTVTLTVTDDDGGSDTTLFEFVVVYDPDGGSVSGGGWIWSAPGFCSLDELCAEAEGRVVFGFVSRYHKGANVPSGETQFQFKAGSLSFHSTEYEWLVVSGPQAQYKGSGTINGTGDYGFLLTAGDSAIAGGPASDTFRIKIWDKTGGDTPVYDTGTNAAIGGGSIVIHK